MIIFDTETTALIQNSLLPLKQQPRIIEFFAYKLDDVTLETVGELESFINPGHPLEDDTTKITGITDAMVKDAPSWPLFQPQVQEFFLGERTLVAHNLSYDRDVLGFELRRTDALMRFPWPQRHICTVEATEHLKGFRLNLNDLHAHLFGEPFSGAHRARVDVDALTRCFRELVKTGVIVL